MTVSATSRAHAPFRVALLLALLSGGAPALAQSDDLDRDCPPAPSAPPPPSITSPCIVLDASASRDSLADPVVYRWKMGDGQTREGIQFEHCYAKPGRYVIELDVVDAATGEVREHELERVVDFAAPAAAAAEPMLRFSAPATAKVGESVTFSIVSSDLPPCLPPTVRFNWNFRDGLLGQGKTVTHTFRRAGTFTVRAAIDGSGLADCLTRVCVTQKIVIEP